MSKIVEFNKVRKIRTSKKETPVTIDTFTQALERDIQNLAEATGKTTEEAIKVASDFYRKYPMLIEHVRSPEYMFGGKE